MSLTYIFTFKLTAPENLLNTTSQYTINHSVFASKKYQIILNNFFQEELIDLMQLTYEWLKHISLVWDLPIPEMLKLLYIDVFKIYM